MSKIPSAPTFFGGQKILYPISLGKRERKKRKAKKERFRKLPSLLVVLHLIF